MDSQITILTGSNIEYLLKKEEKRKRNTTIMGSRRTSVQMN